MLKVKISGLKGIQDALKKAKASGPQALAGAIYVAANSVMTEAKQRAPVDLGPLRASGYVTLPAKGPNPKVELGFGGPSAPYALIQHERTEFKHEVGEAKYLENAINATDVAGIIVKESQRRFPKDEPPPTAGPHPKEPE
jgi:hypothetical protein